MQYCVKYKINKRAVNMAYYLMSPNGLKCIGYFDLPSYKTSNLKKINLVGFSYYDYLRYKLSFIIQQLQLALGSKILVILTGHNYIRFLKFRRVKTKFIYKDVVRQLRQYVNIIGIVYLFLVMYNGCKLRKPKHKKKRKKNKKLNVYFFVQKNYTYRI